MWNDNKILASLLSCANIIDQYSIQLAVTDDPVYQHDGDSTVNGRLQVFLAVADRHIDHTIHPLSQQERDGVRFPLYVRPAIADNNP